MREQKCFFLCILMLTNKCVFVWSSYYLFFQSNVSCFFLDWSSKGLLFVHWMAHISKGVFCFGITDKDVSQQKRFLLIEIPQCVCFFVSVMTFDFSVSVYCANKGFTSCRDVLFCWIQLKALIQHWLACRSSPWGLPQFFHMDIGLYLISWSFHSVTRREEKAQAIWS